MKAVFFREHGEVNQLEYGDLPDPVVGPGEVIVKVKACALNHLDIWARLGIPGVELPMPHVSGSDVCGVIEEIGPGVSYLKQGMKVIVSPGHHCPENEFTARNLDSLSPEFYILGFQVNGGYAEKVKVPAEDIIAVSDRWTEIEWASFPLVFLTAWHMLISRAQIQKGETVLIHAAGSGVGSAAIQIAKWAGARVLTTASSEEKLHKARELGADYTINYKSEDWVQKTLDQTQGKGVDVVFEHVGPQVWDGSVAVLAKGGRLVTCGATSGPDVAINLRALYMKQITILGNYMGSRHELDQVVALLEKGEFKPVIDSVYPLVQATDAQQRMLDRLNFGKIILSMESGVKSY